MLKLSDTVNIKINSKCFTDFNVPYETIILLGKKKKKKTLGDKLQNIGLDKKSS